MGSYKHVWDLDQSKRTDEIHRLMGNAMPIAYGLSLVTLALVIGLAVVLDYFK